MKMIAVWGSSGSGKSTVAVSMAAALAKQGKNVVVVNLDMKTPSLPLFLPKAQLGAGNSIGEFLGGDILNYNSLRSKIHIHPQSQHIGFAGLVSGENPISTKIFEREKIMDFLRVLDESPFNYIIFDCESNTFYDQLTLLALEISDYVFRVLTADVKGYEFEKSAIMWMGNSENFAVKRHKRVLNMVRESTAVSAFEHLSGEAHYTLPFAMEVYNRMSAGELIVGCIDKISQKYEAQIEKMVKEVESSGE